jgi:hypothetical protein
VHKVLQEFKGLKVHKAYKEQPTLVHKEFKDHKVQMDLLA